MCFVAIASGYYTSAQARNFTFPTWWLKQAECIHEHESRNWHIDNYPYSGGFQFTEYTWKSVGGLGLSSAASIREQEFRAYRVWKRDENSWREWPDTRKACGLK